MLDRAQLEQFNEDGYVIIPGINESVYDRVKAAGNSVCGLRPTGYAPTDAAPRCDLGLKVRAIL